MKPISNLVVDTICHTTEIGLTITGAADADTITIIGAALMAVSNTCPKYGRPGKLRGHILCRLAGLPVVGFPSRLDVRVPCFLCTAALCPRKIFRASLACADGGPKLTHRVTRWILQCLATDRMSASTTAKALGIGRDLVNQVVLDACRQFVHDDPYHLGGVHILGIGEHIWRHTREPGQSSNLVTILVDLTPPIDGCGPAQLPDLCPGRDAEALRI